MHKIFKKINRKINYLIYRCIFMLIVVNKDSRLIGTKYGNWCLPVDLLDKIHNEGGVCISGGVGEDISFEYELSSLSNLRFKLYDFTPRSLIYFNKIIEGWSEGIDSEDGKLYFDKFKLHNFKFIPYGLGVRDESLMFAPPINPNHVSWSQTDSADGAAEFAVLSLKNEISKYDKNDLFICKLDIEGSEASILFNDETVDSLCLFRIILIELDYLKGASLISSIRYLLRLLKLLRTHILFYSNDYNVGFVKK